MTTPAATARIRWEPAGFGGFIGRVGTLEPWLFHVWQSGSDYEDVALGEWVLSVTLPAKRRTRLPHGCDPEALKAAAEEWLEEFVQSLGASFPAPECDRCHVPILGTPATDPDDRSGRRFCSEGCLTSAAEAYHEQRYQPGMTT